LLPRYGKSGASALPESAKSYQNRSTSWAYRATPSPIADAMPES
jgi:hypothetical protein